MTIFPVSAALIGRAVEVSALIDAVDNPQVHTMLISGEAGIGKSRLVKEFAQRLGEDTWVLIGRCPEVGTEGLAFAPFLTIMRTLTRRLGVEELATLLPPKPALAHWLPQLAAKTGHVVPSTDRICLFGEILTVLEQVALGRRLVLVLEDVHWADDRSRDLLMFLVTNLVQGDVQLVATYRPAEAGPLRSLIAELSRNPGVQVVHPKPLTQHEVGRLLAALLGHEPGRDLTSEVFARSNGNPLFVEALSQSPGGTPAGLTDLLLGFRADLTPEARAVLALASVVGSRVRHELLAKAAQLSPDSLLATLRELIDRQLLLTAGTDYEFRHVLLRQAIYDDLLPAERIRLHARLAESLLDSEDPAELAHHAAAAGDVPQALAASWQAAVSAGSIGAHAERLRQLQRVLALWDQAPQTVQSLGITKVTVLEHIIEVATACEAIEHGIEAASAALALIDPQADPLRAAQLCRRRAYLRSRTGEGPGEDLETALALLPANPPSLERGEVLAQRAVSRAFRGDMVGAADDARAALEIAAQFAANSLTARGYAYLGLATADDDPDRAVELFAHARAAAAKAGDPQTLLDVVTWESAVLIKAGQLRAAIATIQEGLRGAHATFRFAENAPILLVKWTQVLVSLGHWTEAIALVDDAQYEQLPPLSKGAILLCRAEIALARGELDNVTPLLAEAEQLLGGGSWARQYQLRLRTLESMLATAQGNQAEATRILADIASDHDIAANPHVGWPIVLLAARLPAPPAALLELAESLPANSGVGAAYRTVYIAQTTGTGETWDEAVLAWRALEQPYDEAQCLLAAAQAHAAQGNRAAADTALRTTVEIASRLGAQPMVSQAEQVARRARIQLESPTSKSDHDGSAAENSGLTSRELEVLRLVAKGLSNRQIATELFISANTAGVHVSRILTKLGVSTRTQAAAFAHERHLFE